MPKTIESPEYKDLLNWSRSMIDKMYTDKVLTRQLVQDMSVHPMVTITKNRAVGITASNIQSFQEIKQKIDYARQQIERFGKVANDLNKKKQTPSHPFIKYIPKKQ